MRRHRLVRRSRERAAQGRLPRRSGASTHRSSSGVLVGRAGFPVEIGCWEADKCRDIHDDPDHPPVPGPAQPRGHGRGRRPGMLCAGNLTDLDEASLASHVRWHRGRVDRRAGHRPGHPPGVATAAARSINNDRQPRRTGVGTPEPIRSRGGRCGPTRRNAPPGRPRH